MIRGVQANPHQGLRPQPPPPVHATHTICTGAGARPPALPIPRRAPKGLASLQQILLRKYFIRAVNILGKATRVEREGCDPAWSSISKHVPMTRECPSAAKCHEL